ncbi:putative monoglyceride lipase [Trypanosoma theileri]|uniref:Putative monoglyceride lipase n=1 Tax=Trypanosoma theileri TaxID=67003 RepID=A0A1X0NG89_9TRYP|nr:putative monoglyceride lipase [Trypanosoma theileri]ORC83726.1 putative monoglyceride lipase [Trypanosoma theileri]
MTSTTPDITSDSYSASFNSVASPQRSLLRWRPTDAQTLEHYESLMLRGIKYYQGFVAGLNTISNVDFTSGAPDSDREILVLLHGFAGGLACWAQSWEFFSAHFDVYAVDLPGFGRSARPDVRVDSLEGAMAFTCGCLDRWCRSLPLRRPAIFVGHSFGGFIAAHFAMRRGPAAVRLLALADPWGVPAASGSAPVLRRLACRLFYAAKSPLAALRAVGPMGPFFFRTVRPDFANRWRGFLQDPKVFYDYTYHCNAQVPPLGEMLFKACCDEHVTAKIPLFDVLPVLLSKEVPVVMLYGSETWMNAERGFTMADIMLQKGYRIKADTVMNAGHQVFTDNVEEFNTKLLEAIQELLLESNEFANIPPPVKNKCGLDKDDNNHNDHDDDDK